MKKRSEEKKLSTMEHTVLGIIWQVGPCTTYAVMKELRASGSTYYSDRAGTTYPAVERLIAAKLVAHSDSKTGSRNERLIKVTAAGTACLRKWLAPPVPSAEVWLTRDLLRLRVYFLGAIKKEQRKEFLDEARAALVEHLVHCEGAMKGHENLGDKFSSLADLGAVYETRARIAWLDEIRPKVLALP